MIAHGVRLPEFDGVRAVAVFFVIVGHSLSGASESVATLGHALGAIVGNAGLGVQLFFVLSGFLITSLLLREQASRGSIVLAAFYLRRARRILPAFFVYILFIALLQLTGSIDVDPRHFLAAVTQTWNYQVLWLDAPRNVAGIWYFGHYWTLSLEEQFYLLWPLALILTPLGRMPAILLMLAIAMPAIRVVWYFSFPEHRGALGMFFHTASDSLIWGSLLAFLMQDPPRWLLRTTAHRGLRVIALLLVLIVQPLASAALGGAWSLPFGFSLNALGAAFLLAILACHADWRPAFATPTLVFLGSISYSLYIWQQLFLAPAWSQGPQFPLWVALPALFVTAWASWRWVERPFLAMKSSYI